MGFKKHPNIQMWPIISTGAGTAEQDIAKRESYQEGKPGHCLLRLTSYLGDSTRQEEALVSMPAKDRRGWPHLEGCAGDFLQSFDSRPWAAVRFGVTDCGVRSTGLGVRRPECESWSYWSMWPQGSHLASPDLKIRELAKFFQFLNSNSKISILQIVCLFSLPLKWNLFQKQVV